VAFGKGVPRSGSEILLERELLVGEFKENVDLPRSPTRRMGTAPSIVCIEPDAPVTGDAGVIALGVSETSQHIYAALERRHTARLAAGSIPDDLMAEFALTPGEYAELATRHGEEAGSDCQG
jgi:hypothetical protein